MVVIIMLEKDRGKRGTLTFENGMYVVENPELDENGAPIIQVIAGELIPLPKGWTVKELEDFINLLEN